MKKWIFDIFEENYRKIQNTGKKVEGRVPDFRKPEKHYHKINPGDTVMIRVVDENFDSVEGIEPLCYKVAYNRKYDSVREMLEAEGLERVLPEVGTIEDGIKLYHSLPGYEERIKQNGIHAIGLGRKL